MDKEKIQAAIRLFIEGIGEDPNREGLQETPERVAEMCEEIFAGIGQDSHSVIKVLKSEKYDEIVLLKDIPFYSMCEHHLLPFSGVSHVAYIPQGNRVTGISKLARVVNIEARRPQVQERLTTDIAESIMKALKPKGVLVIIEAEHLCMTMRGIKKPGTKVLTSVVRGIFRDNPATRAEVMALIKGH
ncbi:MAG: GTP cyclohydrolase I FolE [Candidatus Kuenenia stuttgartiensis]|nr:GTP cyclohydrolase I FolE [Candidatus Kuenenia stuttgartiensis]